MAFLDTLKKIGSSAAKGASAVGDFITFGGASKLGEQVGTAALGVKASLTGKNFQGQEVDKNVIPKADPMEAFKGAGGIVAGLVPAGLLAKGSQVGKGAALTAKYGSKTGTGAKIATQTGKAVTTAGKAGAAIAKTFPKTTSTIRRATQLTTKATTSLGTRGTVNALRTAGQIGGAVSGGTMNNALGIGQSSLANTPLGGSNYTPPSWTNDPTPNTPMTAWDQEFNRRQRILDRDPNARFATGMEGMQGIENRANVFGGGIGLSTPTEGGQSNHLGIIGTGGAGAPALRGEDGKEVFYENQGGMANTSTPAFSPSFAASLAQGQMNMNMAPGMSAGQQIYQRGVGNIGLTSRMQRNAELNIPTVGAETSASSIISDSGIKDVTSATAGVDRETFNQQVGDAIASKTEEIMSTNQVPPDAVEDTPEQEQFIMQFPEREALDIRAAIDQIKQEHGYSQALAAREEARANLAALEEVYTGIIDDIKGNPDLPKGLAKRRLSEVYEDQKLAFMRAQSAFDMAQSELDTIDDLVNREMDIIVTEDEMRNREIDNNRQMLQMMISAGAIGGMTDEELSQWAQATGMPEGALNKARELANSVDPKDALEQEKLQAEIDKLRAQTDDIGSSDRTNPISSIDFERYTVNYPNAGIVPGDTQDDVNVKVLNQLTTEASDVLLTAVQNGDITTSAQAIEELSLAFPELSRDIVEDIVNDNIFAFVKNTKPVDTSTSIGKRIWNWATGK